MNIFDTGQSADRARSPESVEVEVEPSRPSPLPPTPSNARVRPSPEPTLTDQELLELSVVEDSPPYKKNNNDSPQPIAGAAIPTSSGRSIANVHSEQALAADDARDLFAPLSDNPEAARQNDSLFGRSANRRDNNRNTNDRTPTPAASATPDNSLAWVGGQARGYAMLYALHPRARAVVEKQVQTLLKSRIREPYISVLIDGTFGQDFEYFQTVIQRLSSEGRRLTLGVYISNGPTMRIWDETPIKTAFSRIEPSEFRRRIQSDEQTRNSYAELVDQSRGLFEFNLLANKSNLNLAIPMLEDNLDRSGYGSARALAAAQLEGLVKFVRNPCEGCYPGNNGEALGDILEEHRTKYLEILGPGDGFTLDGLGFTYPDTKGQTGLSPQKLNELVDATLNRSLSFFGLWRHSWQGVIPGTTNVHPDQRNYIASNDIEADFEISVLRRGLKPEETATPANR